MILISKLKNLFHANITKSNRDKYNFVVLSVVISLLRFVRSFVFMRFLDFKELGLISIVMAIIGFFGMLQMGLQNGGYRILSAQKSKKDETSVNNHIYSYTLVLAGLIIVVLPILYLLEVDFGINYLIIISALFFGVITLIDNWVRNVLSAYMNFKELNILEFSSTIISFLFLITIPYWGVLGAFVVIFVKPLSFLILAFIKNHYLFPTKFEFNIKRIRWILSFGFIPFLSGIFVVLNSQFERWGIAYYLNLEALGKFYLPGMYATLFMLVPLSLNKIFFPQAIRKFSDGEFSAVRRVLKNFVMISLIYIVVVYIITYLFIEPVVAYVFPKHLFAIKYIWVIYPGLISLLLVQPIQILLNAAVKLNPIFWAQVTSTLLMGILLVGSNYIFDFTLMTMAFIKSIILIYAFAFYFISFVFYKKSIWKVNIEKERFL